MWGLIRQLSSHVSANFSTVVTDLLLQALLREGSARHVMLLLKQNAEGGQGGCRWPLQKPAVILQGTRGCGGFSGRGSLVTCRHGWTPLAAALRPPWPGRLHPGVLQVCPQAPASVPGSLSKHALWLLHEPAQYRTHWHLGSRLYLLLQQKDVGAGQAALICASLGATVQVVPHLSEAEPPMGGHFSHKQVIGYVQHAPDVPLLLCRVWVQAGAELGIAAGGAGVHTHTKALQHSPARRSRASCHRPLARLAWKGVPCFSQA